MFEELNKETLIRLYIKEHKTTREIAKIYGCSAVLVRYRCIKYGIKLRPRSKKSIKLKKSVLYRLRVKERKPLREIAEILSCSSQTVRKWCKEYGMPLGNKRVQGLTKALLEKLYVEEGKTLREIGKVVGCTFEPVRLKCKQFNIPLRGPGVRKSVRKKPVERNKPVLQRRYVKKDENNILQGIMTSYDDLSKNINPVELLEINLTPAQIKALTCFSGDEELNMSELSRNLGVGNPTMTALIDRLVKAKMVKRERDNIDRRVVRVWLSDSGRETLGKLLSIRRKEMEKILINLDQEELNNFLTSMEMVAQLLTKGRRKREGR
jgi:DNA-binding MarR family transcriptional regulator/transposase-like protein